MKLGNINNVSFLLLAVALVAPHHRRAMALAATAVANDHPDDVVSSSSSTTTSFVVQIRTIDAAAHPDQACQIEQVHHQMNIAKTLQEAMVGTVDGLALDHDDESDEDSRAGKHDDAHGRSLSSRTGGTTWYCYSICKYYTVRGACYSATGVCPGVRRGLEQQQAYAEEVEEDSNGISATDGEHRGLLAVSSNDGDNDYMIEEDHGVRCTQATVVAEAALRELAHTAVHDDGATTISAACRAALLATDKQYTCYNVIKL